MSLVHSSTVDSTTPTRPTESPSVFLEKSGRSKETLLSGQINSGKKIQILTGIIRLY